MTRRTQRLLAIVSMGAVALTACSGSDSVGDASNLAFDQDQADAFGSDATVTTLPLETTSTTAAVTGETTTTVQQQTTTTLPPEEQAVSVDVAVNENSPTFDPSLVQAQVNSQIRFTNNRAVEITITELGGLLAPIGPIAPGAVLIYTATTPGEFNFDDGRPFATLRLSVQ